MSVRVRFAPSPTGYLHVGGLRTALYNYLFAQHNDGKMILRIEDTDRTRFVENAQDDLIDSLLWAGIEFDEGPHVGGDQGPYVQSHRTRIYKEHIAKLLEKGKAFYAFDTSEELDEMRQKQQTAKQNPGYERENMRNQITLGDTECNRLLDNGEPYVIRLKVDKEKIVRFTDMIRGDISVSGKEIDDQVLIKSDGFPTYHLANVVDDHLMEISHVIRGEEWLPSTPKHILLYEAFGWELPEFAHLPLLLNNQKQKLSKRHGDVAVEDFRMKGYLRNAFVNFIALLGWNPTADRDIYSMKEFIELFEISKVNKAGAVFDLKKLEWMNQQYLKELTDEQIATELHNELQKHGFSEYDFEYLKKVSGLFKERVAFVRDIPINAPYMFGEIPGFEESYLEKKWDAETEKMISPLIEKFKGTDDFSHDNLYGIAKEFSKENNIKFGQIMHPLRLMVTGMSQGASMFETMEILGKDVCIDRFDEFLKKFGN